MNFKTQNSISKKAYVGGQSLLISQEYELTGEESLEAPPSMGAEPAWCSCCFPVNTRASVWVTRESRAGVQDAGSGSARRCTNQLTTRVCTVKAFPPRKRQDRHMQTCGPELGTEDAQPGG